VRLGVLGGGQLGQMLALAAHPLEIEVTMLDPSVEAPGGRVARLVTGSFDDRDVLVELAAAADVVTAEWENVPLEAVEFLAERLPFRPGAAAFATAQDRLSEKLLFAELGIPTPDWRAIESLGELRSAVAEIGLPAVAKTRRLGYDGKGQVVVRSEAELPAAWETLNRPSVVEALVPFERELSVLAARGLTGETALYPPVENRHADGILRLSLAPAPALGDDLERCASDYATRLLDRLDYVGVLALELFQVEGQLLANEVAPRVHNSGHWTIEGAETSQFENHVRSVLGLPLGSTRLVSPSAMVNLIGEVPDPARVLSVPGAHLHLYGKEARPGRKLGHVTLTAAAGVRDERLGDLLEAAGLDVVDEAARSERVG